MVPSLHNHDLCGKWPNVLSTPKTLGKWTDRRISCQHSAAIFCPKTKYIGFVKHDVFCLYGLWTNHLRLFLAYTLTCLSIVGVTNQAYIWSDDYLETQRRNITYLLRTYYLLTYLLTCFFAYLLHAYFFAYLIAYLLTCWLAYLLTY